MFHCQRDSTARQLETEVLSCSAATRQLERAGRKEKVQGWEVVCDDTVIFPEGGGQNSDRGRVAGLEVLAATRQGDSAVLFLQGETGLVVGQQVLQTVDWVRRWDNMQQHSGQHLISAILEREHGINTLSWWMAESTPDKVGLSYIELDQAVTAEQLDQVQGRCNSVVREALPVTVTQYQLGDPALEAAHTRGLPADHAGPVRLVSISGVDSNLCCGTHVSNTAQLQTVSLTHTETKKGKHWLYFLVGGRVNLHLQVCLAREKALTKILNNAPDQHIQLVDKMQKSLKLSLKTNSNLLKEVAVHEACEVKKIEPKPSHHVVYKRDGDTEYINTFLKELDDNVSKTVHVQIDPLLL